MGLFGTLVLAFVSFALALGFSWAIFQLLNEINNIKIRAFLKAGIISTLLIPSVYLGHGIFILPPALLLFSGDGWPMPAVQIPVIWIISFIMLSFKDREPTK